MQIVLERGSIDKSSDLERYGNTYADLERYGNTYADWDTATRSEAQQILASVTSFNFIVCFLAVFNICLLQLILQRCFQSKYLGSNSADGLTFSAFHYCRIKSASSNR